MRIVHVTDFYSPRCGGVELHVNDLAHRQVAAGHEVTVLTSTPKEPGYASGETPGGVMVQRLATGGGLPGLHPAVREAARRALRSGRFDVAHVHGGPASPLAWAAAALGAERPTIVTTHSIVTSAESAARRADLVWPWRSWPVVWTAVSTAAAEPLRRLLDPVPVHVLPNAVDVARWQVEPEPRDPDDVLVIAVMRLAARKRPLPLLHILRQARQQTGPGIRLRALVVGDGPLRARMERQLVRHGLVDDVVLAGARSRDDVRHALARSDVFVGPAVLESFGLAALEARCAGVPVLARAESGTAEFVRHGVEGLLVRSDAEMAAALSGLAGDPAARERIAAHNRAVPAEHDWSAALRRTEELYRFAAGHVPVAWPA
jgi:glycosyltransferase involved in cell wall biosynthesis